MCLPAGTFSEVDRANRRSAPGDRLGPPPVNCCGLWATGVATMLRVRLAHWLTRRPEVFGPALSCLLMRGTVLARTAPPASCLQPALELSSPAPSLSPPIESPPWLSGLLLMAAPKKRTSYRVKRVRQAGQIATRGPKLQPHLYMCPVCERMRDTHRVCDRQDCMTYFRHRWL